MFRLVVEDVFFIKKRGVVATGRVESGQLRIGDVVSVNGGDSLTVTAIEAFRKTLDSAGPGDNVGLLFKEADGGQVMRGDVLTATRAFLV